MKNFIANKNSLIEWLWMLEKNHDIWGPVRGSDGFVRFQKISDPGDLVWDYTGSLLPPKKCFLPTDEVLFRFKNGAIQPNEDKDLKRKRILLGLHPCDLHSFQLLDHAMGDGVHDENYFARRSKTILIGVHCMPDDHCFCNLLGTSEPPETGLDLFLTFLDSKVYMDIQSIEGQILLNSLSPKDKLTTQEIYTKNQLEKERTCLFKKREPPLHLGLKELFQSNQDHPLWKELAQRCLSCGSCTAVCPTCFCFDVCDRTNLDGSEGVRVRRWDSCQLKSFTQVASGEIFRKERSDRVRHRLLRKFVHMKERYHSTFCVGCGRCGRACPAKINIPDIISGLSDGTSISVTK